jgi:hypothetical protein
VTWITAGKGIRARASPQLVSYITAGEAPTQQIVVMETRFAAYNVVRALPDGQRVSVGTFGNEKEARRIIDSLSEYWPGDYQILRPNSQDRDVAGGSLVAR